MGPDGRSVEGKSTKKCWVLKAGGTTEGSVLGVTDQSWAVFIVLPR